MLVGSTAMPATPCPAGAPVTVTVVNDGVAASAFVVNAALPSLSPSQRTFESIFAVSTSVMPAPPAAVKIELSVPPPVVLRKSWPPEATKTLFPSFGSTAPWLRQTPLGTPPGTLQLSPPSVVFL